VCFSGAITVFFSTFQKKLYARLSTDSNQIDEDFHLVYSQFIIYFYHPKNISIVCGISGIVSKNSPENISQSLQKMNNSLRHRGPDDEGYVLFAQNEQWICYGNDTNKNSLISTRAYAPKKPISETYAADIKFGFAHRRLSIIDLSDGGHQPICAGENGNYWMVCNGEIYNYIELRDELIALGYVFDSGSDMEVLLKAYICWGFKCLEKFNGMWAFVIYDKQKNILFGARDRFGVKPLYYTQNDRHFAFASEHKAITRLPSYTPEINPNAIFPHLIYGNVELEPESFFKGIFELLPSHYFIYNLHNNIFKTTRYYTLPYNTHNPAFKQAEFEIARKKLYSLTEEAVKIRLRSDIPVGFCLSGGLDSSTIVSISSQLHQKENISPLKDGIKAFTASNISDCDETAWAQIVAQKYNIDWHSDIITSETLVDELEEIIYHQDIPLYSTSTYAQNRVMRLAKKHNMSILLDGQGGDEIFAGYQSFYTAYLNQLVSTVDAKTFYNEIRSLGNSPFGLTSYANSLLKIVMDKSLPVNLKKSFSHRMKPEFAILNQQRAKDYQHQIQFSGEFRNKSLNHLLSDYCTGYYLKNLLRWEDRCSMQYSIESRTPFSDDINLIEFAFSLPANYKIKNGWSKYILRQAIAGTVPDAIRWRKDKKGFSIPQTTWLMEKSNELKALFFNYRDLDTYGLADKLYIENQWDIIFGDQTNFKLMDVIFRYINYLVWLKIFFNGPSSKKD
jgi:asparagine synthase (glutamine-hydrolysing)